MNALYLPESEWKKPEKNSISSDIVVEQTVNYVDDFRGMIRGMPIEFGKKYESDHFTTVDKKGSKNKKPQRCNGFDVLKSQSLNKKSEPKTPSIFSNRTRIIEEMPTFVLKPKSKKKQQPTTVDKVYPVVNALQEMCQVQGGFFEFQIYRKHDHFWVI